MNYCRNCSRIVDESAEFCVYCGHKLEKGMSVPNSSEDSVEITAAVGASTITDTDTDTDLSKQLEELNKLVEKNSDESFEKAIESSIPAQLNQPSITPPAQTVFSPIPVSSPQPTPKSSGTYMPTAPTSLPQQQRTTAPQGMPPNGMNAPYLPGYQNIEVEEDVNIGIKILMSFVAIFLPPVGIIVSIIFMSGLKPHYKKFGQTTLIFSVVALLIPVLCCCVFYVFADAIEDIIYELQYY